MAVYVCGNDVIMKGDDGKIGDFSNVPDSEVVNAGDQQLSVHDLKLE